MHANKDKTCCEEDCTRPVRSRERCASHYGKWRMANRDEVQPRPSVWFNTDGTRKGCSEEGCDSPVASLGLCKSHYAHAQYLKTHTSVKKRNRKLTGYDGVRSVLNCTFEGCTLVEFNPGLCAGHYYQAARGEELRPLHETAPCPVAGCDNMYTVKRSRSRMCGQHTKLANKYGLSASRLQELMAPQRCANPGCDQTENLHIDHDHSCCSGQTVCGNCVRGLLCRGCNQGLGQLQENPRVIRGLLAYLSDVTP